MGFWDRMEDVFGKGIEASKDVIEKARDKAKEMGAKGILKFELMQLEKDTQHTFALLGSKVFELLEKKQEISLPADSEDFAELYTKIQELKEKIEDAEEKLKNE